MRIAYLVLAHKNPAQLARLLSRLEDTETDLYVHLDRKCEPGPFRDLTRNLKVTWITKRVAIRWGGFGTIQATLNGFQEIKEANSIPHYIHVISGQDYPLQAPKEVRKFLERNHGKEFVAFRDLVKDWRISLPKIREYHFMDWKIPGKHTLAVWLSRIMPPRKFPYGWTPYGWANWFTLTWPCAEYLLEFSRIHPEYVRFFKLSSCGDEIYFTSIILHSPFREQVVNNNYRFVDWSELALDPRKANPKVLTREDFDRIRNSACWFARKFDMEQDGGILDRIDTELLRI